MTEEESCYGVKGDNKQKKCCADKEERGVWDWFCGKVSRDQSPVCRTQEARVFPILDLLALPAARLLGHAALVCENAETSMLAAQQQIA